jgi:hypothetical protein
LRIALLGSLTTDKPVPKDADVLVTIDAAMDLDPLARLGRRLQGTAQTINLGADSFLANAAGRYLGRICRHRECWRRVACRALNCGLRQHLNDDLQIVTLSPTISVWLRALEENTSRTGLEQARAHVIEAHSGRMFAARSGDDVGAQVDREARHLLRDVQNFEKSLREAGSSSKEIADAIRERYGFDTSPEDIESGLVWWRVDEIRDDAQNVHVMEYEGRRHETPDENVLAASDIDARPPAPQPLTQATYTPGPRHVGATITPELKQEILTLYNAGRGLNSAQSQCHKPLTYSAS